MTPSRFHNVKGSGLRGQLVRGYVIPERFADRLLMVQADIAMPEDAQELSIREQVMQNLHDTASTPIGSAKSTRVSKA